MKTQITKREIKHLATDKLNTMLASGLLTFIESTYFRYNATSGKLNALSKPKRERIFMGSLAPQDANYYSGGRCCYAQDSKGILHEEGYLFYFYKNMSNSSATEQSESNLVERVGGKK